MKRLIYLLPVAAFAVIAFFMFRSLLNPQPGILILPSPLINKPVPDHVLPALDAQTEGFGPRELSSGKVTVVNVFSSTCVPCRLEAPELSKVAAMPGMTLYGLVWEDNPGSVRQFLDQVGNPFSRIGLDQDGSIGHDWGIYGWPETYVVDGHGIIRFKYIGELTDAVVQQQLLPAIEKAKLAS
jgi:cytochrome c biogenesis protein CcmG/thiol:disulfide interchange protein DsbE